MGIDPFYAEDVRGIAGVMIWAGLIVGGREALGSVIISGGGSVNSNGGLIITGSSEEYGILAVNGPKVHISRAVIWVSNPGGPGPVGLGAKDVGTLID